MSTEQVEIRVDRLEDLMAELITQSKITQYQLDQTNRNLDGNIGRRYFCTID